MGTKPLERTAEELQLMRGSEAACQLTPEGDLKQRMVLGMFSIEGHGCHNNYLHRCSFWLIWLKNRGPCLPGGFINSQGHLFSEKGHL